METISNHDHSASRYYLSRASPNHSMTFCKPEHSQPKNICKDIECSAAGGMYRDGYHIKPRSQRISNSKDIECSAAGGMYRDGNHIKPPSQRISILFVSCLTKSLDDLLQTRTATSNQYHSASRVARTSSVPPQAECIEMETTSIHYHRASRVARTSSVPPQAECIEMETTSNHHAIKFHVELKLRK
jgi:hypothetical protein